MPVGSLGKNALNAAAQARGAKLANLGMLSQNTKALLGQALPNAGLAGAFALMGGIDPLTAGTAAVVDLGLNIAGLKLANKIAPGRPGTITVTNPDGTTTVTPHIQSSTLQNVVQGISPIASSMLMTPLYERSIQQQQLQQQANEANQQYAVAQQIEQRQAINGYPIQETSPGTQFQMQGMEHLRNNLDPFGFSRGQL